MITHTIPTSNLHHQTFGHGPELLLALHGVWRNSEQFKRLGEHWFEQYTVLAIVLPFHGKSAWPANSFNCKELAAAIHTILETHGSPRFSMLDFRFGARLALGFLPELAPPLDRLYLRAPASRGTIGLQLAEKHLYLSGN